MKKYLLLLPILILLYGCSFKHTDTDNLTKMSLMLDYTPNTNHSGIYVAKDLGFYKDAGIDLNIIQPGNVPVESMVSTNKVDLGISYQENLLMGNDNGENLTAIYGILSHNTSGLMSKKDKNIKTPKDLANKTYCGWGSNVEKKTIENLARDNNVDPKSITFANASTNFINSPDSSPCDLYWEFESWAGIEAKDKNIDYNYIPLKDYGYDEYTPIIITSNNYLKNNTKIIHSFINATINGYAYAIKNPKKTADMFVQDNPGYDKQFILDSQNYINKYYTNDSNNKLGYMSSSIWDNFEDFLTKNNIITNKIKNKNKGYTNEFIDDYYKS